MAGDKASPEWSSESVNRQLKNNSRGGSASANVFFDQSIPAEKLSEAATAAIKETAQRIGKPASVSVGRVHKLAKSVSVSGDPEIIAELQSVGPVKAVLPSEVEDILPKPTKVKKLK